MTEKNQVYKCEICGNIIEIVHEGAGQLVCCNQPMKLLKENITDGATEKHVPVIKGNRVIIGRIDHPMEEKHYIEWIEATDGKQTAKIFLKPGDKPEATFSFKPTSARGYCNLHGLWKGE